MKISELKQYLNRVEKKFGDLPVVISRDSEGNSFGTLNKNGSLCEVMTTNDKGIKVVGVCLYPFEEGFYDVIEAVETE